MDGSTKTEILDAAEVRIRANGYHGFSFRDVAQDVGIKSASVHYHFPSKVDLAVEVATRYTDRFMTALEDPQGARSLDDSLSILKSAFGKAMSEDGLMCLCGVLGSEVSGIPETVAACARRFFGCLRSWLIEVFSQSGEPEPERRAVRALATLEGALLVARTFGDAKMFELAVMDL